ncbi:hypothetical protein TRM7557_01300 [Tritonibacter multivorans]|uniref:Glycosyl transferase n=1 Tax=Tritonibacter multivorans TaxID=928856 RepID=A0A0P1GRS6_9RHOB|nr:hypothetical protein [Tritonibacter multivorans]MDA7422816.1 glycosyl transferase [Tritonibacter multivorans]CUH77290.1 hypothetical protein TRM7557_01300 [Tritonibacter multivorans]SFD58932.1 hypothetical protein SAMN04488049_11713 [Tritonibacter multivorans]
MTKQVICINWGTRYGAAYINRLYGMVARNITPPFRFVCFTDVTEGVHEAVECKPLPDLRGAHPERTIGKWGKSRLWETGLGGLEGPVLFIDLDVAIVSSLDPFFDFGDPDDVVLAHNAAKPFHRLGQTSLYRFPVGKLAPILEIYAADPQGVADKYRFEQHFVTKNAPGGIKFWPRAWVRHFRIQCLPRFPMNYFVTPKRPGGDAKVVIFAGSLNPTDAIAGRWHKDEAVVGPWAHIKRCWKARAKFSAYRRYLRPARWIEEVWRE